MIPWVVVRSRNDMPLLAETLAALDRQTVEHKLIVFDNASADGSADEARRGADLVRHVPEGAYVPGRVLNHAMRETDGEIVAFLNADATPADERWLESLLAAFDGERVAAVFGRQVPRPDCNPLAARDTEATFGDGSRQGRWVHCFSMASSAIRRSAWERRPFDESLHYSEDIDWTWRARQAGAEVRYVPDSVAVHSHNYTLRQLYHRQYGEGEAEARILDWPERRRGLLRYAVLPWGRQTLSDWRYFLARGRFGWALAAPAFRLAQFLGHLAGFRAGWRERTGAA